jgi:hypothetical protein
MAFDLTKRRSLRATTTLHSEAIRKRTAKKQEGWWRQHSGSKSTLAGITPQAFDCCHHETLEIQGILSGQPLNVHDPPIIGDIVSNLVLADVRLIGEPWGAAAAYQMVRAFLHCWHAPFHQTTDDEQHSRHQHQVED